MTQCIIHKIRFSESFTSLILECFAKLVSLQSNIHTFYEYAVAPHAGAWIETPLYYLKLWDYSVAPHAGAWIETSHMELKHSADSSHPTRVRGLKQQSDGSYNPVSRRTPRGCVD